jgi:hypothetical protein
MSEGWDRYTDRAAGGYLLRAAADTYEIAGAKGQEEVRHVLDANAAKLRKCAFQKFNEEGFRDVLASVLAMVPEDIDRALVNVRARAATLRGQLHLFAESAQ